MVRSKLSRANVKLSKLLRAFTHKFFPSNPSTTDVDPFTAHMVHCSREVDHISPQYRHGTLFANDVHSDFVECVCCVFILPADNIFYCPTIFYCHPGTRMHCTSRTSRCVTVKWALKCEVRKVMELLVPLHSQRIVIADRAQNLWVHLLYASFSNHFWRLLHSCAASFINIPNVLGFKFVAISHSKSNCHRIMSIDVASGRRKVTSFLCFFKKKLSSHSSPATECSIQLYGSFILSLIPSSCQSM